MVFFTCNACGASLKKNQVEKHYRSECRNCNVLSCMDCGRDFYGDEYAKHTKCISEAEKYQGTAYKPADKKGEAKQETWLEKARIAMQGAKVSAELARLLEKVVEYPNIPRKKRKFENFVRNSCNVRDQNTLDKLWLIFTTEPEPETKPSQEDTEVCSKSKDISSKDASKQENSEENAGETQRKKKKRKTEQAEEPERTSKTTEHIENSSEETPKLKKKRKSESENPHSETSELKRRRSEGLCITEETPKLKLKKKKQKSEESEELEDCSTDETCKQKKKRKSEQVEGVTENGEKPMKKRKKGRSEEEVELTIEKDNSLARRDTLKSKKKRESSLPGIAIETVAPEGSVGELGNKAKKTKKRKKVESLDDGLERTKG